MTNKRFRLDTGCIIDQEENKVLSDVQVRNLLNNLAEENEQLKEELKEFKDFVYSDEKILCYSCVNCLSKGIYQVECSEKGKVDLHGSCIAYLKKEVEE